MATAVHLHKTMRVITFSTTPSTGTALVSQSPLDLNTLAVSIFFRHKTKSTAAYWRAAVTICDPPGRLLSCAIIHSRWFSKAWPVDELACQTASPYTLRWSLTFSMLHNAPMTTTAVIYTHTQKPGPTVTVNGGKGKWLCGVQEKGQVR